MQLDIDSMDGAEGLGFTPLSVLYLRCGTCLQERSEPFAITETELRNALEGGTVPKERAHEGCTGVERVVGTAPTIFAAVEARRS